MGQCSKGDECTEWHPKPCRWYKQGKCKNGDKCKWMHYDKDGKPVQKGSQSGGQTRNDKPPSPRQPSPKSKGKGKGKGKKDGGYMMREEEVFPGQAH